MGSVTPGERRRAELFALVQVGDPATPLVRRVCEVAVDVLEVSAAGIVLAGGRHDHVRAYSTALAVELEDLELKLGQGPCLQALRTAAAVLVDDLDLAGSDAWPAWAARARARGVRAVFAFPVQSGPVGYGSLDLYRTRPGPLSAAQLSDARTLTEIAGAGLGTHRRDHVGASAVWRVAGDGTAPVRMWGGPVDATVTVGAALTWPWPGVPPVPAVIAPGDRPGPN